MLHKMICGMNGNAYAVHFVLTVIISDSNCGHFRFTNLQSNLVNGGRCQ